MIAKKNTFMVMLLLLNRTEMLKMKTKLLQWVSFFSCLLLLNDGFAQSVDSVKRPGIEIVSKLDKPKKAAAIKEKDLGGYLLVYFLY